MSIIEVNYFLTNLGPIILIIENGYRRFHFCVTAYTNIMKKLDFFIQ